MAVYVYLKHESGKRTRFEFPFKTANAALSVAENLMNNKGIVGFTLGLADGTVVYNGTAA